MAVEIAGDIVLLGIDRIEDMRTKVCPLCGRNAIYVNDACCVSATGGWIRMLWWCKCGYRKCGDKLSMPAEAVADYGLEGATIIYSVFGLQAPKQADCEIRLPIWEELNQ